MWPETCTLCAQLGPERHLLHTAHPPGPQTDRTRRRQRSRSGWDGEGAQRKPGARLLGTGSEGCKRPPRRHTAHLGADWPAVNWKTLPPHVPAPAHRRRALRSPSELHTDAGCTARVKPEPAAASPGTTGFLKRKTRGASAHSFQVKSARCGHLPFQSEPLKSGHPAAAHATGLQQCSWCAAAFLEPRRLCVCTQVRAAACARLRGVTGRGAGTSTAPGVPVRETTGLLSASPGLFAFSRPSCRWLPTERRLSSSARPPDC